MKFWLKQKEKNYEEKRKIIFDFAIHHRSEIITGWK
jgi:hypothetical protein